MAFDPYNDPRVPRIWANQSITWRKAYIKWATDLLTKYAEVPGGWFCKYGRKNNMTNPTHHNAWVSGPVILKQMNLIEPTIKKTPPDTSHSHIHEVRVWKSKIFDPSQAAPTPPFKPRKCRKSKANESQA